MADAQYVIDVAASFSGEQTLAQVDALQAKLVGAGATAATFQDAVVKASRALDTARASSIAANEALASASAEYRQLEQAANQAAKAQEKAAQGSKGVVDLAEYRAAVVAAQQASAALSAHADVLRDAEAAAKAAKGQEDALSTTLANVKKLGTDAAKAEQAQHKAYTESAESASKLEGALNKLGGPVGLIGGKIVGAQKATLDLNHVLGEGTGTALAAASGVASVVAVVIAVVAAFAAATVAAASWAIGLANTNRELTLTASAFDVLNPQVAALEGSFGELEHQTGLSRTQLQGIAKSLIDAHVAASDLPAALQAAALSEAALGQGGAQQFVTQMQASGKAVQDFSKGVSAQLGGIVSQKLLGLDEQAATFRSNLGGLFGSLNIEPVLTGLQKLVGLFDASSASGRTIKLIFTSVFQPLIDQVNNASTVIEAFVLGFEIGLVTMYIGAKPVIKAITGFFDFNSTSLQDVITGVTKAGEYLAPVFVGVVAVFAAVAVVIGAAVAAAVAVQLAIYAVLAAGAAFAAGVVAFILDPWDTVKAVLSAFDLTDIGSNIIQGLVNGITSAAGNVVKAVTGTVTGAIDAAKDALGIHSPSKVFAEIGGYTAEGFAQGVDDGADQADDSIERLASPPAASAAPAAAGSKGAGKGTSSAPSIVFQEGAIQIVGVKGADDAIAQLKDALTQLLEGFALQAGG